MRIAGARVAVGRVIKSTESRRWVDYEAVGGSRKASVSRRVMASAMGREYVRNADGDGKGPSALVVFLHGLGDTGEGWSHCGVEQALPYAKFVYPTAPVRPISLNMGMPMPGWFDIRSLELEKNSVSEDKEGMDASVRAVEDIIEREGFVGDKRSRVVVAGFSQGGAISLLAGMRDAMRAGGDAGAQDSPGKGSRLAGVAGLSTWLPMSTDIKAAAAASADVAASIASTHILLCHGDADEVVKHKYHAMTLEALRELGAGAKTLEHETYPGLGHSSCAAEMQHFAGWLRARLPPL